MEVKLSHRLHPAERSRERHGSSVGRDPHVPVPRGVEPPSSASRAPPELSGQRGDVMQPPTLSPSSFLFCFFSSRGEVPAEVAAIRESVEPEARRGLVGRRRARGKRGRAPACAQGSGEGPARLPGSSPSSRGARRPGIRGTSLLSLLSLLKALFSSRPNVLRSRAPRSPSRVHPQNQNQPDQSSRQVDVFFFFFFCKMMMEKEGRVSLSFLPLNTPNTLLSTTPKKKTKKKLSISSFSTHPACGQTQTRPARGRPCAAAPRSWPPSPRISPGRPAVLLRHSRTCLHRPRRPRPRAAPSAWRS